ncbi:tetratricopeptide repeat protein [Pyxidicoccus caerfyrddinensis]|uniref:tetratricopeptide repeat protein n=1 Tax=Pyxidicoccus caerfyrddinensis TaxID=2709663 RepID=UPI0013D98318|nr:toll/interleukin-1 receptor domain-containing protein [Pyxidicoccus caerfyrddinensis]
MSRPVFISYARGTSRPFAEALQRELGVESCFLDTTDIAAGERFPEVLAEGLFASKVAVVFADAEYFRRWYCLWELETLLAPYSGAPGVPEAQQHEVLRPLVVTLAPGGVSPAELQWVPPLLRNENRVPAEATVQLAQEVRARLAEGPPSLQERLIAAGVDARRLNQQLLERTLLPEPARLGSTGPVYPPANRRRASLGVGFKGRAEDLWRISFALSARTGDGHAGAGLTVALSGLGGTGKTTLAWEYLHRFGPRHYPGGTFWVDADVDDEALEAQHHGILQSLRPSVPDLTTLRKEGVRVADVLAGALEEAAAQGHILYVVDNVPEPRGGTPPRPLETWCPGLGVVSALFTSRLTLKGGRVVSLPVDVLRPEAAIALLLDGMGGVDSSNPAWARVVEWVGRLPLALSLLNSALLHQSLTPGELWALVEKGTTEVLEERFEQVRPVLPHGSQRGVVEAFQVSYEKLSPVAQRAIWLLAHLAPEPIPVALLESFGARLFSGAVRAELVARSFVSPVATGGKGVEYFGLVHRVLADFLRQQQMPGDTTLQEACAGMNAMLAVDFSEAPPQWALMNACQPHAEQLWASLGIPGIEHADTLTAMQSIAETLRAMGEWTKARRLQSQVLEVRQRTLGPVHQDTLEAKGNLAHTLGNMGASAEARPLKLEVLEACERILGADHPDTLKAMDQLAATLGAFGEWAEARRLQSRVLEARQRAKGDEDRATLTAMHNLALTLEAMGDMVEARRLQEHVLEVRSRIFEPEHPAFPTAMSNLAATQEKMGELPEAHELQRKVLEACQRNLGAEHRDTLAAMNNLAATLWAMGQYADACRLQRQVLEIRRRTLGAESPDTLTAMNNLAVTLEDLGEAIEARELHRQVLEARTRTLGARHPATLTAMNNMALSLEAAGERVMARRLLEQALEVSESVLGDEHPDTLQARRNLAGMLSDMREWAASLRLQSRMLNTYRRGLGLGHPKTLQAFETLAVTLRAAGEPVKALFLQERVVVGLKRASGVGYEEVRQAETSLAQTLEMLRHRQRRLR